MSVALSRGVSAEDARVMAEHYLDAELRGVVGMARLLWPRGQRGGSEQPSEQEITIERETPHSALVNGGNHFGVVVAEKATSLAIAKARVSGIAVVAANNHHSSGLLAYHVERAARKDLIAMAVAATEARVVPYGGSEPRLGNNPIAFGFPTADEPIVWDITTSSISGAEHNRRAIAGELLPEGVAIDALGHPTRDPHAAQPEMGGALLAWGGHRGSGLAVVIQLIGLLCDIQPVPIKPGGFGFLIVAINPSVLLPVDDFKSRAAELAAIIRSTPPSHGFSSVRMPYDRSLRERELRAREGIVLSREIYDGLVNAGRGDATT
jgi:LDH2 family malate/lactate/ureidoglycolate dehydrogenase